MLAADPADEEEDDGEGRSSGFSGLLLLADDGDVAEIMALLEDDVHGEGERRLDVEALLLLLLWLVAAAAEAADDDDEADAAAAEIDTERRLLVRGVGDGEAVS